MSESQNPSTIPFRSPEDLALLSQMFNSQDFVFLSGFHSVKHALRFNADVPMVFTTNPEKLFQFCESLAPDILKKLEGKVRIVKSGDISSLHPDRLHWTEVWGITQKPNYNIEKLLLSKRQSPLVILEHPMNLGNVGAVIRTAAAFGASGVVILGEGDPWNSRVLQGASGLQFALPVGVIPDLKEYTGPLFAIDPTGEEIKGSEFPKECILVFGTEREGLTNSLKARVTKKVRIPMRPGVSSLNLAVSVGVILSLLRR